MRIKISISIISMVLAVCLCIGISVWVNMSALMNSAMELNDGLVVGMEGATIGTLTEELEDNVISRSESCAIKFDDEFWIMADIVELIAKNTTNVLSHPEYYNNIPVSQPDPEKDGELSLQLMSSGTVDLNSPDIKREIGLLANSGEILMDLNEKSERLASCYVASEKGVTIQADYTAKSKFDENGNILPIVATERPWYVGAKEAGELFFTDVTPDISGNGLAVMCGAPFYRGEEFAGVAGAGVYIDYMQNYVKSMELEEGAFACIMDNNCEVIISGKSDSELGIKPEGSPDKDLRKSENETILNIVEAGTKGKAFNDIVYFDDNNYFVAAAPMETVGWTFVLAVPYDTLLTPITDLIDQIANMTDVYVGEVAGIINQTLLILLLVGLLALVISIPFTRILSKSLVSPIQTLTRQVKEISGDNLDFEWALNSKDETDILGRAFEDITGKMKEYISNLTEVTAEKERIGAELNVAAKIQKDILPRDFSYFETVAQLDLFASMDPAKEVGGDFYDFFRIDGRHVGLVMADVSGKGVPAALFMMITKTLVKNQMLLGSHQKPSEILSKVNNTLAQSNDEMLFCTCWIGILNIKSGQLRCASAGHEYPIIRQSGEEFITIEDPHGVPLGVIKDTYYTDYDFMMYDGSSLFIYTDGVPDSINDREEIFGRDRMIQVLNSIDSTAPRDIIDNMRKSLDEYVGQVEQFDDITMMSVYFAGVDDLDEKKVSDVIEVEADMENFPMVSERVEKLLREAGCAEDLLVDITICLEEIYVNIASYAYQDKKGKLTISYEAEANPFYMNMTFMDEGVPYNPLEKTDPDITLSANQRKVGGLGIYFVKKLMDDVRYVNEGGKNILTLIKEQPCN